MKPALLIRSEVNEALFSFLKKLQYLSHQIFGTMHEVLNIVKKNN